MSTAYFDGLTFIGHAYAPTCRAWIERRFEYFALCFCRSGRISWAMDGYEPRFLNGPVAWWTLGPVEGEPPPFYVYGTERDEHWEHYYATFNGRRAIEMVKSGLIPGSAGKPHYCAVSDAQTFASGFHALHESLERDGPQSALAVHQLEGLLLQLQTQAPPAIALSPLEVEVRDWLEAIRLNPQSDWNVEKQATFLSVSAGHLRRIATQMAGVPPHRFVLERRLDLAAAVLRDSGQAIKVLAAECGFEDLPHFTRLFKRRYGLAPAAYRREARFAGQESRR